MKKIWLVPIILMAAAMLLGPAPALADEIEDQINQALQLYQDGKLSKALSELEFAAAQLRQKKAEALGEVFPKDVAGWKAQKVKTEAMGAAMFGVGVSAAQNYRQESGSGRVEIKIVTDSPLLQSVAMMMNNPMFAQGGQGGRLIRVSGEKALLKEKADDRAELQTVLDGKVLLEVKVSRAAGAADLAKDFFGKIDLDKLRDLTR